MRCMPRVLRHRNIMRQRGLSQDTNDIKTHLYVLIRTCVSEHADRVSPQCTSKTQRFALGHCPCLQDTQMCTDTRFLLSRRTSSDDFRVQRRLRTSVRTLHRRVARLAVRRWSGQELNIEILLSASDDLTMLAAGAAWTAGSAFNAVVTRGTGDPSAIMTGVLAGTVQGVWL